MPTHSPIPSICTCSMVHTIVPRPADTHHRRGSWTSNYITIPWPSFSLAILPNTPQKFHKDLLFAPACRFLGKETPQNMSKVNIFTKTADVLHRGTVVVLMSWFGFHVYQICSKTMEGKVDSPHMHSTYLKGACGIHDDKAKAWDDWWCPSCQR